MCDPSARPDIAHMFRTMILAFALVCLAAADTICDLTTVNGNDYSGLCDGTFDGELVCAFRIPSPGRRVHTGIGAGRVGVVRGQRCGRQRGKMHAPPSACVAISPMIPPHPPSRRYLYGNDLTGSVPTQLGLLTNLKEL